MAGPDRLDPDQAPLVEGVGVRCMWIREKNPDTGEEILTFLPGCDRMTFDPEHEQCTCDTIAHRYKVLLEQRRDCDEEITHQRRRLRAWHRAGLAAFNALTGNTWKGVHPEELARAVARQQKT